MTRTERLYDRLTGRVVPAYPPPSAATLGRYARHTAAPDVFSVDFDIGSPSRRRAALPDAVTVAAVLAIGERVAGLVRRGAPLGALVEVSPMVDGGYAQRMLSRQSLEAAIDEHLPYLRAVCFRPAARLRSVDRQVPVARARTVTTRSIVRLAAHSEDWAARRPDGVRPDRVLSPERETDLDLYENRVVARLVAELSRYLSLRMAQIRSLGSMFSDIQRYIDDISGRPWQTSLRLWELVAALVDQADWKTQAQLRLAELEQLSSAVSALRGSPLWRGVNRQAALGTTLRSTNLFGGEERYRHVAELWRRLVATRADSESADEAARHTRRWCEGFVRYAWVLAVRAFDELGATPVEPAAATGPMRYQLRATAMSLRVDRGGVFLIERDGAPVLRVVALPHALTASRTGDAVAAEMKRLTTVVPNVPTVVLYPGSREERQELPVQVRLRVYESPATPAPDHSGAMLWPIPVSPLEVDSVVRLARAVRWLVEQPRFAGYPYAVPCGATTAGDVVSDIPWLAAAADGIAVTRVPGPHELVSARMHLMAIQRGTARFRRLGSNESELENLWDGIEQAVERTVELTRCPRCNARPEQPERALRPRAENCFHVSCTSCGAAWESRRCRTCTRSYPVLDTAGESPKTPDGDCIDQWYGTDLLVARCMTRSRVFICPWCATCANVRSDKNCPRCYAATGSVDPIA
ncbi:hypothetical protein [Plantactinospora sp. KBS50]|uniref:hypothetical protein n=1 Tax=Plantactinospora sp. KBS50 TaxID=2024580 RepID=UPI000BAAB477|nr:hypothetical protein [Plantactinospora sp. KBS50]ASW55775.1 hypothetical protein CIK06_18730 [Plantactinospora sp. KBS50]